MDVENTADDVWAEIPDVELTDAYDFTAITDANLQPQQQLFRENGFGMLFALSRHATSVYNKLQQAQQRELFLRKVFSPLKQVELTNDDEKQFFCARNNPALFVHVVHKNGAAHLEPTAVVRRKYNFKDSDYSSTVKTVFTREQRIYFKKIRQALERSNSYGDLLQQLNNEFSGVEIKPRQQTILSWALRLVFQRYILTQVGQLQRGTESVNILARAVWYRTQPQIQAPPDGLALYAWEHYHEFLDKFLKQLVLMGPELFYAIPVRFARGGRHVVEDQGQGQGQDQGQGQGQDQGGDGGRGEDGDGGRGQGQGQGGNGDGDGGRIGAKNPDITIDDIKEIIVQLQSDPTKAIPERDLAGGKKSSNQVRSFLNRIGITKRRAMGYDKAAARKELRADMYRFVEFVQKQVIFGGQDHDDAIWYDESSISINPAKGYAWSLKGRDTKLFEAKKVSGGSYNLMLSCGIIGQTTFLHFMLWIPQQDQFLPGRVTLEGTGTRKKRMGNIGTVMQYFVNHYGVQMFNMREAFYDNQGRAFQIQSSLYHEQNLDPLMDMIARLRQNRNDKRLWFFLDNASMHFAQSLTRSENQNAKYEANNAFDTMRNIMQAKGLGQNVNYAFLPKYQPQFNPCERVFAHLKQYLSIKAPGDASAYTEENLLKTITDFARKLKQTSIIRLIHGCRYRLSGWPEVFFTPQQPPAPQDLCNQVDRIPTNQECKGRQVVCSSTINNVISKYLPVGAKRWHVLSKHSTLFEPQETHFIRPFSIFDRRPDDLSLYFPIYSGFADDLFHTQETQRSYTMIADTVRNILELITGIITRSSMFPKEYTLFTFVMLSLNSDWKIEYKANGVYVFRRNENIAIMKTKSHERFSDVHWRCKNIILPEIQPVPDSYDQFYFS